MVCFRCCIFSDWGAIGPYKENGCVDRSDISVTLDKNHECGDKVGFAVGFYRPDPNLAKYKEKIEYAKYTNWFPCHKNSKCIHSNSRCDLHPHPDCIYENEGQMVAEDEEGCFDEYKSKGLVPKSANLECQSPMHNSGSIAIQSIVAKFNGTRE